MSKTHERLARLEAGACCGSGCLFCPYKPRGEKGSRKIHGYTAFDLDGTLAKREEPFSIGSVGEPVPAMVALLRRHLKAGDKVKIMTARAHAGGDTKPVREFLRAQGLPDLPITSEKDPRMALLYDDRAVSVEADTGRIKFAAEEQPEAPPGVELWDPDDSDTMRGRIQDSVAKSLQRYVNGYAYGGVRLEVDKLRYDGGDRFSLREQNEAILSDKTLYRRLRGDVRLVDEKTGEVLDKRRNFTLARVPYLTQRGTFVHNGSEYSPVMQSRLLPGVYARRRENGAIESHINVRPGTGAAMRLSLDPETAQYRLKFGSSELHAYSVFKDLGVTDEELERRWGKDVLEANRTKYSRNTLERMYAKAYPKWERDDTLDYAGKAEAIKAALDRAQVATSILRNHLPNLYDREKSASWRKTGRALDAARKMVKSASFKFSPDFSADEIVERWSGFGLPLEKQAAWDLPRAFPTHWQEDDAGWLDWYAGYQGGVRTDQDAQQKARWQGVMAKQAAIFPLQPTPEAALELVSWGIDPVRLVPPENRTALRRKMAGYRDAQTVRLWVAATTLDDATRGSLMEKAAARGARVPAAPDDGDVMRLALDGYLKPEDLL
jgi:hypothetical protein